MILFCDEDIGTNIPKALHLVGYQAKSINMQGWRSKPDTEWLTDVGTRGWLAFSSNKRMLQVHDERETIIREKVGIVFLSNGEEHLHKVLWLLLVKWAWLEKIDIEIPRPFAFVISPKGRIKRETLELPEGQQQFSPSVMNTKEDSV